MLEAGRAIMSHANPSAEVGPEPTLTLKLSDGNEFYCSACHTSIASLGNGRFIVGPLRELVEMFRNHVERFHTKGKEDSAQS